MPTHSEKRTVPYTPEQMFDLIADIKAYPEFLPWCSAARERKRTPLPDHSGEILDADLVISFKVFRERFGSRVTL
ncbi:MAG: SRPBCC family protein, partial [Pseudomonadota bacterium]